METEELEEVERHSRKSVHGHWKDSSSQAVSCVDLICDDESEASDHVTEKESQTHYIPIRRNSRYYRSFRLRNRGKARSSREVQTESVEASLKNGNTRNELLNKDELLRIFHKGLSLHVKRDMTAAEEQWLQRLLPSYPGYRGNRPDSPSPAPAAESLRSSSSRSLQDSLLLPSLSPPRMELLAAALSAACALDHEGSAESVAGARPPGSESPSMAGPVSSSEESPVHPDCPAAFPEALQVIHPMTADSWKNFIEQIGLLYQEYRDKSTRQEIETRRLQDSQTDAEECTATEDTASQTEATNTEESKAVPQICLLRNSTSRFNLWQDLPEVRSSGVLNILQPDEIKLQEAMFELVTSEASYYKSLNLLIYHFMENERLKKILHPSEAHILFSNVLDVMAVSERFLLDLEKRVEENIVISDVCDIVYQHTINHFSVYVTYVSNQTYQERAYKQLLQDKPAFREVISHLELDPKCKGLPFSSFLILPFQRITRLKLLVQNILKKVEEKSEREITALEAHKELETVVKACNEGVRKMSRTEQMISIQKMLEFKIKSVPIISHSRWLLKQGELQQMNGPKTSRTLRTKKLFREVYLFLFNDLLVLCRQISSDKYQVFDSAPRGLLRVEELEDQGQSLANVFILRLLENADDREVSYMLKASSQSEMKRWMILLAPNRRTKFVSFTSRLMDCPQVQCVHPYVAQQPDELSLELADVLNILEKTDDGWIFGERLHDQERGWFPSSMGEEIMNPKIRSQNLKECFRVHKTDDSQRRKMGSRNRQ
uniref:Neuronal guanine nucleotide exchange factor n=2 Tax=Podarcis muralis TaxID=64176 RepID=A0A670IIE1_PODMU|nr:ephexin-1 isoform X1 [Podarcis muralis]XP_028586549.1 ephexin-1 isoform X1 [Podarcis muralis]XP_028586550.1 ephexin-1 isoform X1 [Podarcis muralis]